MVINTIRRAISHGSSWRANQSPRITPTCPLHRALLGLQVNRDQPSIRRGDHHQKHEYCYSRGGRSALALPQVTSEDIGGLKEEIQKLRDAIELSLDHRERFQKLGVQAPRGILLCGAPGTGKTLFGQGIGIREDVCIGKPCASSSESLGRVYLANTLASLRRE